MKNDLKFSYFVELIIVIASAGIFVSLSIRNQYLYQFVSESYNFTSNKSTQYCSANGTDASEVEKIVTDETSKWQLYITLSSGLPAIVSGIVLLSWSNKIGKRITIFIPLLGYAICNTMMVFIIKYSLPPYMVVIAFSISGLTGLSIGMLNATMTYLSAVVQTNDEKLRRFTLAECGMGLGGGIMTFGTGFWITKAGFFPSMCLSAACSWFAVCLVPLLPKPPLRKNEENHNASEPFDQSVHDHSSTDNHAVSGYNTVNDVNPRFVKPSFLSHFKLIWKVYTTESSICVTCESAGSITTVTECDHARTGRVWRMWFYLIAFNLFLYPVLGISIVDVMYFVAYPLCFSPMYLAIRFSLLCFSLGVAPFTVIFFKSAIRWRNTSIIILGICISLGVYVTTAFAKKPYVVFVATAFSLLSEATAPIMRAQLSSLASQSEQGAVFGLVSGTENFSNMIANITYLLLLPATLHIFHGFIFLFSAGIQIIPLFMMMFVWVADRKRELRENEEDDASPLIDT